MPRRLAKATSSWAQARTWATEPGALSTWSDQRVWIESTTASAGRSASRVARMSRRLVSVASLSGACGEAEAGGAHPDLGGGLLAGDVDGGRAAGGEGGGGLQEQRRLADAGVAADEDRRGGDEAAAEDAVELGDAGGGAGERRLGGGEVAERDAAAAGLRRGRCSARGSSTMVFQAPQASQRPAHLAKVAPQAVQAKAGRRALIG